MLAPEFKKRGIRINIGHHNFFMFLPEKLYLEEHPEYFDDINGRRGRQAQFSWNLKCREALDEVVHRIDWFLYRHPEVAIMDFWPSDGIRDVDAEDYETAVGQPMPNYEGWEEQAAGTRITARLGNPYKADIYAALTKHVAEALSPKHPEMKFVLCAYADVTQPSTAVQLPENVVCTIAMYWRCYKHNVFEQCVYNDQYRQIIQEWTDMYPGRDLQLSEYYMGMTALASLPFPILSALFDEWPRLIEMGVSGVKVHTGRDADFTSVPYNINYLAFQSIVWDDASSVDEFLESYCRGFFGDAWQEMMEMYQCWETCCRNGEHTQPAIHYFHWFFDEATCRRSQALIEQASRKTDSPKIRFRLFRLSLLMTYSAKALEGSEALLQKTRTMQRGEPTEELDRQLLPWVREMTEHAQQLIDLDIDIYGHPKATSLMSRDEQKIKPTRWAGELATILKSDWATEEFNEDILEARQTELKQKSKAGE